MDAGDSWRLALLVVCLGLSGFFSASETAFIALPRARLLHLVRSGKPGAERVAHIVQRPERFLATVLLGNNLVNTAAAALATVLALSLISNPGLSVLAATFGVTTFLLLFGETAPKNLAWRSESLGRSAWWNSPSRPWLRYSSYSVLWPTGFSVSPMQPIRWVRKRYGP